MGLHAACYFISAQAPNGLMLIMPMPVCPNMINGLARCDPVHLPPYICCALADLSSLTISPCSHPCSGTGAPTVPHRLLAPHRLSISLLIHLYHRSLGLKCRSLQPPVLAFFHVSSPLYFSETSGTFNSSIY